METIQLHSMPRMKIVIHASRAVFRITQRTRLTDARDLLAHAFGFYGETVGE